MIEERGGYKTGPEWCPKLPSLRQLTKQLRDLHEAWSHPDAGGEFVRLYLEPDCDDYHAIPILVWKVHALGQTVGSTGVGQEYIPGDGARFDARAAARRLLADAREAGYK